MFLRPSDNETVKFEYLGHKIEIYSSYYAWFVWIDGVMNDSPKLTIDSAKIYAKSLVEKSLTLDEFV